MRRRLIINDVAICDDQHPSALQFLNSIPVRFIADDETHKLFAESPAIGVVSYTLDTIRWAMPIIILTDCRNCRVVSCSDGPLYIGIGDYVMEWLKTDRDSMMAAVYHEIGHLMVDHRYVRMSIGNVHGARRLIDEVNADNYAVRHVGLMAVIEMLVISYTVMYSDPDDDRALELGEIELIYRMGRLGHRTCRNIFMDYYPGNTKQLRKYGYGPLI